ncbi:TlpA family protein disulfide reductase [Pedobacter nyackensis]|uniref:Thiol-disulfide isomerase or thioredoxin n=1 Tax=Pedobacter nyackensis TaxID=475255 RepID=A0A1W2CQD2_9SPHI|nr:TlpA disulfide reductase family protein [Pedobacter nyackensis]SMC87467.1 Thiol-disulfide isomerase or thioredoxin [Pedobacter nyackensis]
MKILKNNILFFLFLLITVDALAQEQLVNVTGLLTEKKHAEIAIWSNTAGSPRLIATAVTDPADNRFSLAVPYRADATYQLRVTIMKMGKLRLERDLGATFPIQLNAGENINVTLNPAQFDEKALKGMVVEKGAAKFSTAMVSGTLTNWKIGGELSLEKVVEGRFQKIETFNIEKGNPVFSLLIPVKEEGFYYLSTTRWKKRLYLKPNDKVALNIDGAWATETEWVKTTAENKVLVNWEQLIQPASVYGYNLEQRSRALIDSVAFKSAYQSLQPKVKDFLAGVNTPNEKFNKLFKTAGQLDNSLLPLRSLLNLAGKKHLFWLPAREFSNVPAFYREVLKQNKINSADLLLFGEGNEYINLYAKFSLSELDAQKRQGLGDAEKLQHMMSTVSNETLKAFLLKGQLEDLNVNNYSEFKHVFLPYAKYTKPESVKWKYNHVLAQFAPDTVFIGKSAYDFTLPDVNGKPVSMKDFKGKVVLIDVWATWCGPCKAQMPFLKEVEEAYKGNDNIVFVGISVDAESAKQKWLDMIKEKGLDGVQLLDKSGKAFANKYKINAIPRFLLIDKKGNWVEVRCPLPENKARLKDYIDRELNKGV